jgi:hypothetical protein
MDTFALFGNASASKIVYDFHRVGERQTERIRLMFTRISDNDVRDSANKGVYAALKIFEDTFQVSTGNHCLICEFADDDTNNTASGQSAGLAFCLKFAYELYQKKTDQKLPISIAATGELSSSGGDAKVNGISEINRKLMAAIDKLKAGDKIFYPDDNDKEIDSSLRDRILNHGIELYPIRSVKESILKLLELPIPDPDDSTPIEKKPKKRKLFWMTGIIVTLLIIVYFMFQPSCYDQVLYKLEYGKLIEAKEICESCLGESSEDSLLNVLYSTIKTNLNVLIDFEFLPKGLESEREVISLTKGASLSRILIQSQDGYRLKVIPQKGCFLYIFQFDSNNGLEKLFPLSDFKMNDHHLNAYTQYLIPGNNYLFYPSDPSHHGQITLYAVASPWQAKDVEEIFNKYESATVRNKTQYYEKLIERLHLRDLALKDEIKGIFYKREIFLQE